ncbi:hypothetical protein [Streptomyces sp. NPDC058657]
MSDNRPPLPVREMPPEEHGRQALPSQEHSRPTLPSAPARPHPQVH